LAAAGEAEQKSANVAARAWSGRDSPSRSTDGTKLICHSPDRGESARMTQNARSADLNYLFLRQQVERSRAAAATNEAARNAHQQLARCYERYIEDLTAESFAISSRAQIQET
jgi:hypothetical protein